jgi:hypothetical protein
MADLASATRKARLEPALAKLTPEEHSHLASVASANRTGSAKAAELIVVDRLVVPPKRGPPTGPLRTAANPCYQHRPPYLLQYDVQRDK